MSQSELRAGPQCATVERYFLDFNLSFKKPIGICFLFDQHLRAEGNDAAFKDADTILETPGMYAVIGGDVIDNAIKFSPHNSASTPSQEWQVFTDYARKLSKRLIVVVAGNHDLWSYDLAGIDATGWVARNVGARYARYAAYVSIDVSGTLYIVGVRHYYPGSGRNSPAAGAKRWIKESSRDIDVAVVGHRHTPGIEHFHWRNKWRSAIQAGTYQKTSDYAARCGFDESVKSTPVVILPGNGEPHITYSDLTEQAIKHLRYLRSTFK